MSLPANDLLTAFHDGELNSAERVAVEQHLAASAEARRELRDIQQLSVLLKELPRERLSSDFPQQVLRGIEREMLIPSRGTVETDLSVSSAQDPFNKTSTSRRWVGLAAVLTSAAGLLLLVRAVDDRTDRNFTEARLLARSPELRSAPSELAHDAAGSAGANPAPKAQEIASSEFQNRGGFGGGMGGPNSVAAKSASTSTLPEPDGVSSPDSPLLYLDQTALRDPKIGDPVRAMQTEGTEVAVVWLTVVDRQEGLAGLQLLLADHRITRAETDSKSDKAPASGASTGQMYAVFVESDPAQLAAAVQKLRAESFLQSLKVDQPIELAQLFEGHAGLDLASARRRSSNLSPLLDIEKKNTRSVKVPPIVQRAAPPSAKGIGNSADQLSKQVTLEFPRETLVENQQARSRGVPRTLAADEKVADKASAGQRPMQVLFVVVDQAQSGKPAPSTNSPKPSPSVPVKTRSEPAKPTGKEGAA